MLKKLYEFNCLNVEKLIVKYSKELSLSNDEILVLIKVIEFLGENDSLKIDEISKGLKMTDDFISNTIAKFMDLGYLEFNIEIKNGIGEEKYSTSTFFTFLEKIITDDTNEDDSETDKTVKYLESKFSRNLTASELDRVLSFKDSNIDLEDVKKAYEKMSLSGNVSIIRLEKKLFSLTSNTKHSKEADRIARLLGNK